MELIDLQNSLTKVINTSVSELNKTITSNHLEQTKKIGEVITEIAVFKEHCDNRCEQTDVEFRTINGKLTNDFADIKTLKEKALKENGVAEWKGKSEKRLRFAFFVILSICSLAFAIDRINSILLNQPDTKQEIRVEERLTPPQE